MHHPPVFYIYTLLLFLFQDELEQLPIREVLCHQQQTLLSLNYLVERDQMAVVH